MGIRLIRYARALKYPKKDFRSLQIGIFGSQLGNRETVEYFQNLGVDFVSSQSLPLSSIFRWFVPLKTSPLLKLLLRKPISRQLKVHFPLSSIRPTPVAEPYWSDPLEIPYWL
jgi:hypothetical protein